jgi:hypothetical protein
MRKKLHFLCSIVGCGLLGYVSTLLVEAAAISIAPGGVTPVAANLVAGAGAVCPGTQFGTAGLFDGAFTCNNTTMVGGVAIITAAQTAMIGAGISKALPPVVGNFQNQQGGVLGTTALQIGQNFSYNRRTTNNKPADNLNKSAGSTTPVGSTADATAVMGAGTGTGTSKVVAKKQGNGLGDPLKGVAVGFVSDPLTIEPIGAGTPGTVAVTIGLPGDLLSLEADAPGDVASALYELLIGTQTLLSLEIDLDSSTSSLGSVGITLSSFDAAALGFGSMSAKDYVQNVLLPFLTFDPITHTLSEIGPILVSNGPFLLTGTEDFTWNFASIAGDGAVPEPSTLPLVALAALLMIAGRRARNSA